jgi:hypothetical protein
MLSIEKLVNYLNVPQRETETAFCINKELVEDYRHIYDSYILENKFQFLNKKIRNLPEKISNFLKSEFTDNSELINDINKYSIIAEEMKKNTFFSSILNSIMTEYRHFAFKSKLDFVKDTFQQMAHDLNEKSLYQAFGYNKNYKFSHNKLEKYLRNMHEYDFDEMEYDIIRQYFVDYLSLNVFVISENKEKFNKIDVVSYKYENKIVETGDRFGKYNPSVLLWKDGDRYFSIIKEDTNGTFLHNEYKDLLEAIANKSIPYTEVKKSKSSNKTKAKVVKKVENVGMDVVKKYKLADLQTIAKDKGLSIYKTSEKTGKSLKKTIKELEMELFK